MKKIIRNGDYLYIKDGDKAIAGYSFKTGKFWGRTTYRRCFQEWIDGNTMSNGRTLIKDF